MRLAYIQDYITNKIRTVFVPDHVDPEINAFESIVKITSSLGSKEYEYEKEVSQMKQKKKKDTIEPKPYIVFGSAEFAQNFSNGVYGKSPEEPDNLFPNEDKFKPLPQDVFEKVNPCKKYDEEYEQFLSSIRRLKKNNESKKAPIVKESLVLEEEKLKKTDWSRNFENPGFEFKDLYPRLEKDADWVMVDGGGDEDNNSLDEEIKVIT